LLVPAVAEAGVGPALLGLPAGPLALLPDIATPAADTLVLARIAGAALLAIGAVCALSGWTKKR